MGVQGAETRTAWKPSARHLSLLTAVQAGSYGDTVCELCAKNELPRRTYYDWMENADFRAWWEDRQERFWVQRLGKVREAMYRAAVAKTPIGSHADRKLFLERFDKDYAPRSRQDQRTETKHDAGGELLGRMDQWIADLREKAGGSANG